MKKIAILTSGGDSPGMNAAIRAAALTCFHYNIEPWAIHFGFQGLLDGNLKPVDKTDISNIINQGGTYLKTSRCERFKDKNNRQIAIDNLVKHDISGLIIIGGNGSLAGAYHIAADSNIHVVGIPATIDNDIDNTDFSIGYDTALNTIIDAVDKLKDTANSHNQMFLVEVMGNRSGCLAFDSGIATGAEQILIPESKFSVTNLIDALRNNLTDEQSRIIIISEEVSKAFENNTSKIPGIDEIALRINKKIPQLNPKVIVLGHLQRGGKPSSFDRILATRMGVFAVEFLNENKSNRMLAIQCNKITAVPLHKTLKNKYFDEKKFPNFREILLVK